MFPILFAPYFAATAADPGRYPWAVYTVSFLFAVTIAALVSIQEALEDPFNGDVDDIDLAVFAPRPRRSERPATPTPASAPHQVAS